WTRTIHAVAAAGADGVALATLAAVGSAVVIRTSTFLLRRVASACALRSDAASDWAADVAWRVAIIRSKVGTAIASRAPRLVTVNISSSSVNPALARRGPVRSNARRALIVIPCAR